MSVVWILIVVIVVASCWFFTRRDNFTLDFGFYRYGYPYSYFGTWYRPQGYWGPSYYGSPYGFGQFGYGGKQQDYTCRLGCTKAYRDHCKEGSASKCQNKLKQCLDLCKAHEPYYDFDESY